MMHTFSKRVFVLFLVVISAVFADTTDLVWMGHSLLGSGTNSRKAEFTTWSVQTGISLSQQFLRYGVNYNYDIVQSWKETPNKDSIAKWGGDFVIYNTLYKTTIPADSFYKYQMLYAALIDSIGAKGVLYDDWHTPSTPFALKACKDYGLYIAPVQSAYKWVKERYPEIHYLVDWAHAAEPLGYLAGCVTWSTLFCMKPFGFDVVYAGLDPEEAHLMQQVAWNTVTDTPYVSFQPWSVNPPLVSAITLSGNTSSIQQFRNGQFTVNTSFTDGSSENGTKWAIFSSLSPEIITVSHSGKFFAGKTGTAKIVAIREQCTDTLDVTIVPTTMTLDSIRITPRSFGGYVGNRFQFAATGYFRDGSIPVDLNITPNVLWKSGDTSVFTIKGGLIERNSARGGAQFAVIELANKKDTVHFSMMPEFQYLSRIKFLDIDTVLNPNWNTDNGKIYNDSTGFGWLDTLNAPYYQKRADWQGINYYDSNFLRVGYVTPYTKSKLYTWGTFKLNAPDGDYIIKAVVGNYRQYDWACTLTFANGFTTDTLVQFKSTKTSMLKTVYDTVRVFGMDGLKINVYGPISSIIVCSMEGVDIDSVAYDDDLFILGTPTQSELQTEKLLPISIHPNPCNPSAEIRFRGQSSSRATVYICDISGRLVRKLNSTGNSEGLHNVSWNGKNMHGSNMASGIYTVRISSGRINRTHRLVLVR